MIRFDVFGSVLRVERRADAWWAAWEGSEGKLAPAGDVVVPATLAAGEVRQFLDDHFHERATRSRPAVRRL